MTHRDAPPPRRSLLRVAVALAGIVGAVLVVTVLARLPWTVSGPVAAGLGLLGASLVWAWRRRRAPARAQRWHGTASGMDPHLESAALADHAARDDDRDTLLPALLPRAERRKRQLVAMQGRLTVHVGPGVSQVRLPATTVQTLAEVLDAALDQALDDIRRQPRTRSRLRFELDLRHGETGSHLRLAVIGPGRVAAHDGVAAAPSARAAQRRPSVASMQRLATAMGAQFDIEQGADRSCVEWVLPLERDREAT